MNITTILGSLAALCTTISYFPQLKKCWTTGHAKDLSLKMFLLLAAGVSLWLIYGWLQGDVIIMASNGISLAALAGILYFKVPSSHRPV
jgi:MtN3 and saliva related transmembrane protein